MSLPLRQTRPPPSYKFRKLPQLSKQLPPLTTTTTSTMDSASLRLEPVFAYLSYSLSRLETTFYRFPGSHVVARYVKSSHQNDPGRTVLEIILIIFAIRTLLQARTRSDSGGKHFIQFTEKVCLLLNCLPTFANRSIGDRRACRRMDPRAPRTTPFSGGRG